MTMRDLLFKTLQRPAPIGLSGRQVLVLGLGESGLSAARWIAQQGGKVRAADSRARPPGAKALRAELPGAVLRLGAFKASLLEGAELLCLSPGLSLAEPLVQEAIARGIPVAGDIELFAWAVRGPLSAKVLGVTGTNGKSTVAALAGHLLRSAGIDCEVAGNIGPAALDALMRRRAVPSTPLPAVWVLELSSYQLETTWALDPDAAAMLNLSEDHLDRYPGLAEYAGAKARIFIGQGTQVLNRNSSASMALAIDGRLQVTFGLDAPPMAEDFGIVRTGERAWLARGSERILPADELPIAGEHNAANALAACALALQGGALLARLAAGLRSFRGLPHRMQLVAERDGVAWFDDSKGTNVGATVAALGGLPRRAVLILGGEGKGQDFGPLRDALRERASRVLLIGQDAPRIRRAIASAGIPLENCASLEAAVARAAAIARPGEAVLLSPACASFDMFRDYRHRGEVFAAAVRALAGG